MKMKFVCGMLSTCFVAGAVQGSNQEVEMHGACDYSQPKHAVIKEAEYEDNQFDGRTYYEALLQKAVRRTWALPVTFYGSFTSGAFDSDGQNTTIAQQAFNGNPTIKEIYLFSKLSDNNKVRIENIAAQGFERGDTPLNAVGGQFGNFRDDLYTTLLAPTEVRINAEQKEFGAHISLIHQSDMGRSRELQAGVGISLPIKSQLLTADVNFVGGKLFTEGFAPDTTRREDSLKQFHRDFIDVFDFFQRAVLDPKGLTFVKRTRKVGIGDLSLFGYLDFGRYFKHADSLQLGATLIAPSAGKSDSAVLLEPELGNGGALQADFFANIQFVTPLSVFNPTIRAAAQVSGPVTSAQRVPQLKTQPEVRVQVDTVPDLYAPALFSVFNAFHVDMYSELDTTVPAFADATTQLRTRMGTKFVLGVGNYFYNVFDIGLRIGAMYTFMHKRKDHVLDKCNSGCPDEAQKLFLENTVRNSHTFSWNLAYQFHSMVEVNIGSSHMFAGKNIPRVREFSGSVVFTF